jgi:sugar-specific transcriptional regulator TrmB
MEILEVLNKIGLEEKESSIYLALLELGTADVGEIAKKSGQKRTTCYTVIENLKQKSLVSQVPSKINLYTAEDPNKLVGDLYKKQELLKRFLPNLEALHNSKKEKPQVQLYEGAEGVVEVYKKIYAAKEIDFFGSIVKTQKYLPKEMANFVLKSEQNQIKVRDLLDNSAENIEVAKKAIKNKNYYVKLTPADKKFFNDSAIFGSSVVFFSFEPKVFAVLITSKEISHAMKVLFEMAWASAIDYNQ